MAVGQPPFAKAVSSPPLYISLKIPQKCHKNCEKENREGGDEKEGSEEEVGEKVAKIC
jgi:hypothetical protein